MAFHEIIDQDGHQRLLNTAHIRDVRRMNDEAVEITMTDGTAYQVAKTITITRTMLRDGI